jgi:hypothetical protein
MKSRILIFATLLIVVAACIPTIAVEVEVDEEGPYEDIQSLLASAAASSADLASLDRRGAPRVVEVHHHHQHLVPQGVSKRLAERLAEDNTPPPPPVRIVSMPNRARAARHAAEDAQYASDVSKPTVTTVDVKHTVNIVAPIKDTYTIRGPKTNPNAPPEYHFPLVDRALQRPHFSIIADTDGSEKAADWKPHTATELQAEAVKLLARAKALQAKKNEKAKRDGKIKDQQESMGVFDQKDDGYEDELTRLKRVSARMNRLREQIEVPHNQDSFEGSIARKKYFLKIYRQLKADATKIIETYALRTGNSIFELFGDGKIDPSIAAFLPPNSVAAILAQYANPTTSRDDETPRDVISGTDAKRIKYSIDYYNARKAGTKLPLPPEYALTDEEEAAKAKHNNPLFNKVIATQAGDFGQGRPSITTGNQAIGRSSVHVAVVNPTETQDQRGLPFQVNLKIKDTGKLH